MLKWAVVQKNATPGLNIPSYCTSENNKDLNCFKGSTNRLHVARRRNNRAAVRRAGVRSLRKIKDEKENRLCTTPETVSLRTRDNFKSNQMVLRDVSNSPDPYAITPRRHNHNFIKRRQSHPLNLMTKKSISEHSKSAPTNVLDYLKTYDLPKSKPLTTFNSSLSSNTSQKTPQNQQLNSSFKDISEVVDMRKSNSTLKSLLTMQIEYSPGPLSATQSLVNLRQRLTKTLNPDATPQSTDNPLYYVLNPSEKIATNGITISCNEQSPILEGLLEEKSLLEQVSGKFEFISNLKKENSRTENTLVSSLSQRLEWLRLNNNYNNLSLLNEGENVSLSQENQVNTEKEESLIRRKRRDLDLLKRQKCIRRKIRKCCDGACKTGCGPFCDKGKPKIQQKPKLMGLTLPLGIPSPITSEDSGLCSLGLEGIQPLSSSLLENEELGTLTEKNLSKYREDESISTSLIVNKCSPSSICSSLRKRYNEEGDFEPRDAWSEEVVLPLVKTPKLVDDPRSKEEESNFSNFSFDFVLPSPLALVEKRSRSRRCLQFVSPSSSTCQRNPSTSRRPLSLSCPRLKDGREGAGELELSVNCVEDQITVYVGRGIDLHRHLSSGCNAYVKVALVPSTERKFFRTPVQRESSCPNFNEKFSFKFRPEDLNKQILVSVWHRDRDNRKSEFLGCVSLAIKNAIKKEISGSFYLVAQSGACKTSTQQRSIKSVSGPCTPALQSMMARRSGNARLEEVITLDEEQPSSPEVHCKYIAKKRLDDDSSFLRHLELEPLEGEGGRPPLPEATAKGGRTPFTTTKQLTKQSGSGFGFSIAWVQPPRVERVEAGQPADKAGIRPGDFVIFIDRYNVVTMSEEQVLQIIKSCGNELTLEIYRKASPNGLVEQSSQLPYSASAPAQFAHTTRSSTACSAATSTSLDFSKRRLNLPQVAFTNEAHLDPEDSRKRAIYQLLNKEQIFATNLQFGINRFLVPLTEKREFLNPTQHHILFQNIEELSRLTEETLEQVAQEEIELVGTFIGTLYFKRIPALTAAYRRYCGGIKRADFLLAEKSKSNEFNRFCAEPPIPRKRPDLTTFVHKPLEHYREMLKLLQTILNLTKTSDSDHVALSRVVSEMQGTFKEVTAGLMEPEVEGRPLLSVQDLESRLVFTRCKPFILSTPGRQWIFGGDLSKVEGRAVRPFWTLLFTDMMVFAKVSRDRVLFITEEPISLLAVSQAFFNIRKKANEFRLLLSNSNDGTESPANATCGPDMVLSRTPKKSSKCRSVALRAPTPELKAVWQNLIQRQIIYLNTIKGRTPSTSPLESPDPPFTLYPVPDSHRIKPQGGIEDFTNASVLQKVFKDVKDLNMTKEGSEQCINEIIDHKCRQLGKMKTGQGSALHLAEWMKDQLGNSKKHEVRNYLEPDKWMREDLTNQMNLVSSPKKKKETRYDELDLFSEKTISKNTEISHNSQSFSENQATAKSENLEKTVSLCRKCHKTCINVEEKQDFSKEVKEEVEEEGEEGEDSWSSLMMLGMYGILPSTLSVCNDPFLPVEPPSISVLPPTPDKKLKIKEAETNFGSLNNNIDVGDISYSNSGVGDGGGGNGGSVGRDGGNCNSINNAQFVAPSEQSVKRPHIKVAEEKNDFAPKKSPTLRRFGTLNSLEKINSDDHTGYEELEKEEEENELAKQEESEDKKIEVKSYPPQVGDSIRGWTVRAGSFVAAKMAFFERLSSPDNTMTVRKTTYLERYLKPSGENHLDSSPDLATNTSSSGKGEEEGETSGATSGEEIWGTPTSGGEFEEELIGENFNFPFVNSPRESNSTDDSEQMLEDLLISLPIPTTRIYGGLPRRRLEPLLEEDDTESSSAPCSPKAFYKFKSGEGSNLNGFSQKQRKNVTKITSSFYCQQDAPKEHKIRPKIGSIDRALGIHYDGDEDEEDEDEEEEEEEENFSSTIPSLLQRLGLKKNNTKRDFSGRKSNRLLKFLSHKKEDSIIRNKESAIYGAKPLFKYLFNKDSNDDIHPPLPTVPLSSKRNGKQVERKFWKHLKKRRNLTKSATTATTASMDFQSIS